jgi:hypothetical protein
MYWTGAPGRIHFTGSLVIVSASSSSGPVRILSIRVGKVILVKLGSGSRRFLADYAVALQAGKPYNTLYLRKKLLKLVFTNLFKTNNLTEVLLNTTNYRLGGSAVPIPATALLTVGTRASRLKIFESNLGNPHPGIQPNGKRTMVSNLQRDVSVEAGVDKSRCRMD